MPCRYRGAVGPPGEVRYARASGNVDIAYTVFGEGTIDLVMAAGFITHLDLQWRFPFFQTLRAVSRWCRVLIFDKRGTGLSDRSLGFGSLEERADDIRAVMDAAGSERAVIYGASEGGPMALLFAATYPQHVQALVLYGSGAKFSAGPDYPIGLSPEQIETFRESIRPWGNGRCFTQFMQHAPDTAETVRILAEFERNACTPQMVMQIWQRNIDIDVRPILPAISVPTLVMHCRGDPIVPVELGRYLADHIPGARYAEIDGDFHGSWEPAEMARLGPPFAEFLSSIGLEQARPPANRALATILFTDIVGSTGHAVSIGDNAWRELLDRHDALASDMVTQYGGRLVKTTGDGLLASFDRPSAAIETAQAIRENAAVLGLRIRSGVHTGEVELRAEDLGGISVHIGARIAALANPGEILVSRTVKDLVTGSGIGLHNRGEHALRGVAESWQVYSVEP